MVHSDDAGVRRLLRYWALGLMLYLVSLSMLWFEAWAGVAQEQAAMLLTIASLAGAGLAYTAIRLSHALGISAGLLNTSQCLYALSCITAAYALLGPMRGVTLSILVVVLVFGGFSSTPRQIRVMSSYAIVVLGLTILWKSRTDPVRYPPLEEGVHFILAATMLGAVAYLAELLSELRKKLKGRTQELANALVRIEAMATRDELTQLFNRRYMMEALERERACRERSGQSMCIAIIDMDHFKRLNDSLGHAAGDAALRFFADRALSTIRPSDTLARWGGEEFLLLLPETGLAEAQAVLERMRRLVGESAWFEADASLRVTFSCGLAEWPGGMTAESAIDAADKAMYSAKREGRNRIAVARAS